jgi:hypothetical protein
MNSNGMEHLQDHKKAFYIGSILPDCTPSFITRRHSIEETFYILKQEIVKITEDYNIDKGISSYYCRHLGIITHYIADYFTFPHNSIFTGSIKEHCTYEKELKFAMKKYVLSDEAKRVREKNGLFSTVEEICDFIKKMHEEYLKVIKEVQFDCYYIVELCHKVVDAILQMFELSFSKGKKSFVTV